MPINRKEKGFTIIEVVLVLAIAGLIFLIVFLALPQLQRSRRDTQRRNDAGRIIAGLESWSGNNNGNYPTTGAQQTQFVAQYVTGQIKNPDGVDYIASWGTGTAPADNTYVIAVSTGTDCDGVAMSGRMVAVRMDLEQGTYCQDSR